MIHMSTKHAIYNFNTLNKNKNMITNGHAPIKRDVVSSPSSGSLLEFNMTSSRTGISLETLSTHQISRLLQSFTSHATTYNQEVNDNKLQTWHVLSVRTQQLSHTGFRFSNEDTEGED